MSEGTQNEGGFVNGRCYAKKAPQDGPPLYTNGDFHFQAHHVGWIVTGFFTLISTIASIWLINKHLQWYTNQQRYIVRLLFMVPIYASISFASYLFWNHSTPLILVRDCYEAIVLTSFFYLLLTYLSPNPVEQKEIFRLNGLSHENDRQRKRKGQKPQKWIFPLGFVKSRPVDGLYFLQLMKWAVLQYCVVRPATTFAAVILNYMGLYCEASLSPRWGHIYIVAIVSLSVTIAMYCLIQLYIVVSEQLKPHRPLLKLLSVKAVVFLTFWQATALSAFALLGLVKDTKYMTAENINIGIGAILECAEMTIFAFLHIKCFTYKVYIPDPSTIEGDLKDHRTPRLKSLGHAMNPMETFRELWTGIVYMFRKWRGKETDKQARRVAAHQGVFGRSRSRILSDSSAQSESLIRNSQEKKQEKKNVSPLSQVESGRLDDVLVDVEREVYLGSERQWLGVGDSHGYVLGSVTREKSEGFEAAVANELYRRGYTLREASKHNKGRSVSRDVDIEQGQVRGGSHNRSWWRSIYQRVSQSGGDDEQEKNLSPHPKRKSVSRPKDPVQALPLIKEIPTGDAGYAYEDPPPPSTLKVYRSSQFADNERRIPRKAPPRASPPTSDFAHRSPEPVKPKANSPDQLGRSDSLLDRVFAYLGSDAHATNTDLDHGTESQPSRPTSLWRAGSANVVPEHIPERSSVAQANLSDGVDPQPATPFRGDVVGTGGIPNRDGEAPTPPPKRSHIRDIADHFVSPPHSPPPLQSPPIIDNIGHPAVRRDPPVNLSLPPQPPSIPEPSIRYDLPSPLPPLRAEFKPQRSHIPEQTGHVDQRSVYPSPMPDPRSRSPQQYPVAGPSSPPSLARPRPTSHNKAILQSFPEPVHHPPPNTGPTRLTPPRSKLTIPTPLAQPLPRGSGGPKRNRTNTLPAPEQHALPNEGLYRESRSRRHSQQIQVPRHTTGPNYIPHPINPPLRKSHRRTSQPLPVLRETSHLEMSPSPSPPQRSSRRLSSPPMSALPHDRPSRSNAVHRKSPGSRSPTQATSPRMGLLAELRSAPPIDRSNFSRYPVPGPGSGIDSPPRNSQIRSPPSPGTPTFVNTHMLPSPTNSPRSDVEEWASAVSSFPPSARTQRP
ncbi:DUF300-domain-containing protein [Thelephora ganbajun]|uniref:DUF300-domain-containing protein n=1 Tax=Thelephora ganbajun TaxID=370292 RepID=A0ACB6ZRB3_THEGA|nr:DUF300-domain-containing protein [Thelephora ganbajun]